MHFSFLLILRFANSGKYDSWLFFCRWELTLLQVAVSLTHFIRFFSDSSTALFNLTKYENNCHNCAKSASMSWHTLVPNREARDIFREHRDWNRKRRSNIFFAPSYTFMYIMPDDKFVTCKLLTSVWYANVCHEDIFAQNMSVRKIDVESWSNFVGDVNDESYIYYLDTIFPLLPFTSPTKSLKMDKCTSFHFPTCRWKSTRVEIVNTHLCDETILLFALLK